MPARAQMPGVVTTIRDLERVIDGASYKTVVTPGELANPAEPNAVFVIPAAYYVLMAIMALYAALVSTPQFRREFAALLSKIAESIGSAVWTVKDRILQSLDLLNKISEELKENEDPCRRPENHTPSPECDQARKELQEWRDKCAADLRKLKSLIILWLDAALAGRREAYGMRSVVEREVRVVQNVIIELQIRHNLMRQACKCRNPEPY